MPKTSQNDLKLLNDFQHLDSTEWDAIRYLETQKCIIVPLAIQTLI